MTKEQEMKARASFTGIDINELLSDKCLIRLTQQQYQDAIQLILHLDNKIRILTNDNQQLMAQISAKAEQPKPAIPDNEKPLRQLITNARKQGKNIRTFYQDLIFTPDELELYLANGRFRWWNICNWELTTRKANMALTKEETND